MTHDIQSTKDICDKRLDVMTRVLTCLINASGELDQLDEAVLHGDGVCPMQEDDPILAHELWWNRSRENIDITTGYLEMLIQAHRELIEDADKIYGLSQSEKRTFRIRQLLGGRSAPADEEKIDKLCSHIEDKFERKEVLAQCITTTGRDAIVQVEPCHTDDVS